eukprot:gene974-1288_t
MIPYQRQPAQHRSSIRLSINVSLCLALLLSLPASTWGKNGPGGGKSGAGNKDLAAGCLNPEGSAALELNNVRTIIYAGGDMWWDRQGSARYEVPKGSGKHSMFLGSLWMGGLTNEGTLKIASQRHSENGPDYYTGPLARDGS